MNIKKRFNKIKDKFTGGNGIKGDSGAKRKASDDLLETFVPQISNTDNDQNSDTETTKNSSGKETNLNPEFIKGRAQVILGGMLTLSDNSAVLQYFLDTDAPTPEGLVKAVRDHRKLQEEKKRTEENNNKIKEANSRLVADILDKMDYSPINADSKKN